MQTEPEQWQKDVAYLAKLADYCAGQGIFQIEGLDDPEDWCLEAYDSFYPMRNGDGYSAQALADGLIASIQRAFEERERKLREENETLRAFKDRVLAATAFVEPTDQFTQREAISSDLRAGLSLRKCATKHGSTVAIVRGIARQALKETPDAQ